MSRKVSLLLPDGLAEWVEERAKQHYLTYTAEVILLLSIAKDRIESEQEEHHQKGEGIEAAGI